MTPQNSSFDALLAWAQQREYSVQVTYSTRSRTAEIGLYHTDGEPVRYEYRGVEHELRMVAGDIEAAATYMLRRLIAGEYAWRGDTEPAELAAT